MLVIKEKEGKRTLIYLRFSHVYGQVDACSGSNSDLLLLDPPLSRFGGSPTHPRRAAHRIP